MKTIKIFLASSEELIDDRYAFGNLVRRLDKIYEKRSIRIELFEWEDYDAAYNDRRKQDEYNDQIKSSDMFLALFHTKAGKFTIEEFDVATEEFRKHASPKVYTYCKDLQAGEQESPELTEFKRRLFEEMGHYWSRYNNRDSMQLHFVMQLQLVESNLTEEIKVEDNVVKLGELPIARMGNLQFASNNEAYQQLYTELRSLPEKIEKARMRFEKFPDDDDLKDDLQQKLDRYNKLKDNIDRESQLMLDFAKQVTLLQGDCITDRMRRAIDAFNQGHVHEATIILKEAEHDSIHAVEEYERSKELTEQKRKIVILSIGELIINISAIMADTEIPIQERVSRSLNLYQQCDELAIKIDYEKEKYERFLGKYAMFLLYFAYYDQALEVLVRQVELTKELYGT